MGKKKYADDFLKLPFWRTPDPNNQAMGSWCYTDLELLRHPRYIALSESAKNIYTLMGCICGSNSNQWFNLPYSVAHKYGYEKATFKAAVRQLKELGFIEVNIEVPNGAPSEYRFSAKWKLNQEERKHFNQKDGVENEPLRFIF